MASPSSPKLQYHYYYHPQHKYFSFSIPYIPVLTMAGKLTLLDENHSPVASSSRITISTPRVPLAEITKESIGLAADDNGDYPEDKRTPSPTWSEDARARGAFDNDEDDGVVPKLTPPPGVPLSPRTTAMVLDSANADLLAANAKDIAATIRRLQSRLEAETLRANDCENWAQECSDKLEAIERNKENEAPQPFRPSRRPRSASTSSSSSSNSSNGTGTTLPEYGDVCPANFEPNRGQVQGFHIPGPDGEVLEAKYIRFVQGANPHAEGTMGQGRPIYTMSLMAPADYNTPDVPYESLPPWFMSALSRHSTLYNTVLHAALKHNDWGVCADIIRYKQCEDQVGLWEARMEDAANRLERAREDRTQARFRLEAARAHTHFIHLRRTDNEEDWHWAAEPDVIMPHPLPQLGRRGRRRNVRGRGRPQA